MVRSEGVKSIKSVQKICSFILLDEFTFSLISQRPWTRLRNDASCGPVLCRYLHSSHYWLLAGQNQWRSYSKGICSPWFFHNRVCKCCVEKQLFGTKRNAKSSNSCIKFMPKYIKMINSFLYSWPDGCGELNRSASGQSSHCLLTQTRAGQWPPRDIIISLQYNLITTFIGSLTTNGQQETGSSVFVQE